MVVGTIPAERPRSRRRVKIRPWFPSPMRTLWNSCGGSSGAESAGRTQVDSKNHWSNYEGRTYVCQCMFRMYKHETQIGICLLCGIDTCIYCRNCPNMPSGNHLNEHRPFIDVFVSINTSFMQHFRHGSLPVRVKYTIYPTVLRRSASVLNSLGFPGCQWETDFSPESWRGNRGNRGNPQIWKDWKDQIVYLNLRNL